MQNKKKGMTLEEFRAISERNSKEVGVTSRIVLPGEEEPTSKATITFVKDSSKLKNLNPAFKPKSGRNERDQQIIEDVIQDIMKNRGVRREEAEHKSKAKITLVKDSRKLKNLNPAFKPKSGRNERDQQIIEDVIQDIMKNRGVSREEAEQILANPF